MYRPQIELAGISASAATSYTKKPNVFRLKLSNGGEYLFHAKDEVLPFIALCIISSSSLYWQCHSTILHKWAVADDTLR